MATHSCHVKFPPRSGRVWSGVTASLAAAFALASSAGCAVAAPYNPDNLPADQVARIGEVCQSVIGVQPGEAHYVACVVSLTGSANGLGHGHALTQARETLAPKSYFYASPRDVRQRVEMSCAQLGFEAGSDGLARCAAGLRASLFAADNPTR